MTGAQFTQRIGEVVPDFELLDVWPLRAHGGADDFPELLDVMTSIDPAAIDSRPTRLLFAVRERLGAWLGWDDGAGTLPIPGAVESTLRARLPEDLRGTADAAPSLRPFTTLYRTESEWAGELSNKTVHGVIHLAWVDRGGGDFQGQMSVYVKTRGLLGAGYLLLITPFRHVVVYPALLRQIERAWSTRAAY